MNLAKRKTIVFTAVLGALAVIIGAFGAHALKKPLEKIGGLSIFETGVEYHFYHTLALGLVAALIEGDKADQLLRWAARFFLVGVFLFSGSLYALACFKLMELSLGFLGMLTPIGGVFFILGWGSLFLYGLKTAKADLG